MADIIGIKLIVPQVGGRLGATPQQFNQALGAFELDELNIAAAATFTTDPVDLGVGGVLEASLTTANITGTLTTVCQTSSDGSTFVAAFTPDAASYATAITGTFGAITTNTATIKSFVVRRYVRFVHTIVTGPVDITLAAKIRAAI